MEEVNSPSKIEKKTTCISKTNESLVEFWSNLLKFALNKTNSNRHFTNKIGDSPRFYQHLSLIYQAISYTRVLRVRPSAADLQCAQTETKL